MRPLTARRTPPGGTWLLETTPGPVIDIKVILDKIVEYMEMYNVLELRYDRWIISVLKVLADRHSVRLPKTRDFGQGYKDMGPAVATLGEMVATGDFKHDDNPVSNMGIRNCRGRPDPSSTSDAVKPVKIREELRIDPAVAILEAVAPEVELPVKKLDPKKLIMEPVL